MVLHMANYNNQNMGQEIGWDDEISQEDSRSILPSGDYDFTVDHFVRQRFNGSAKMCACNYAELHLTVDGVDIVDNLYLNSKAEWRISQFFLSIGQKKKGEPFRPNWNAIPGARGRLKLGVRTWKGRDGEDHQSNEVKEFYESTEPANPFPYQAQSQPSQPVYQQQRMDAYPAPKNPSPWGNGKF
jgi:hypothetical protein